MTRTDSDRGGHFMARSDSLWRKFKEEWVKKLIAGGVALSFLILGLFGRSALNWLKHIKAGIENISKEQASQISKTYLGQGVVAALPFRNIGEDEQYIAALVATNDISREVGLGTNAYLLVSRDDKYETHKLPTKVSLGENTAEFRRSFGVVDIDNDGKNRVFTVFVSGGTGFYMIEVGLYDAHDQVSYTAENSNLTYTDTAFNPDFSDNLSSKPNIRGWLVAKGSEFVIAGINPTGLSHETNLWRQSQGEDFKGGLVQTNEFPGPIPVVDGPTVECEVEDAQFIWISFFKSGVFGYDRRRNVHFVVWMPDSQYNWVSELTSGEDYLWIGGDGKNAQFAFDKRQHFLLTPSSMSGIKATEFAHPSKCKPQPD